MNNAQDWQAPSDANASYGMGFDPEVAAPVMPRESATSHAWQGDSHRNADGTDAFATAIHLDERIAQFNSGMGEAGMRIIGENLRLAKGIVVDSNALRCEIHIPDSDGDDTSMWQWLHYYLVAFRDSRGRQMQVWSDDAMYGGGDLPLGSSVVALYADAPEADDVRVHKILTYADFNVSTPGWVRDASGGKRWHCMKADDDYQDPRSFGSLWRSAEWGECYKSSGMDGFRVHGRTPLSEDGKQVVARARDFTRRLQMGVVLVIIAIAAAIAIPMAMSATSSATARQSWIFVGCCLLAFVICGARSVAKIGRKSGMRTTGRRHEEQVQVLDVVTVPLFDERRFCGYGYVAKVGAHDGVTWAMCDPEFHESYIAQGGRPPVVKGDAAVLSRTGRRRYVRSAHATATTMA